MNIKDDKNGLLISLDTKIYPAEAIFGASYVFVDRAYILLDQPKKEVITVNFKGKGNQSRQEREKLKGEFMNELLHYAVRISLLKYNKKIRERLIERALFSGIDEEKNTNEDFSGLDDDPLGIAVPWDEKFGEKNITNKNDKKNKKRKK